MRSFLSVLGIITVLVLCRCLSSVHLSALAADANLELTVRYQMPVISGRLAWEAKTSVVNWKASETCLILVDVWDKHWCPTATERLSALAMLMNQMLTAARKSGVLIVHAPSDCMDFYKDYPQRKWVLALPNVTLPADKPHAEPQFPLDASDGGCDVPAQSYNAWHRENPLITIANEDAISAGPDGHQTSQEIYNILSARKIKNVLYAGVHENMCIMTRPFAIKQLVTWGEFNVSLVRELVDVMYNPMMSPYVTHEEGAQMMTGFIEKFWATSTSMYDFLNPRSTSTNNEQDTHSTLSKPCLDLYASVRKSQANVASGGFNVSNGHYKAEESQCGSPELFYLCPSNK